MNKFSSFLIILCVILFLGNLCACCDLRLWQHHVKNLHGKLNVVIQNNQNNLHQNSSYDFIVVGRLEMVAIRYHMVLLSFKDIAYFEDSIFIPDINGTLSHVEVIEHVKKCFDLSKREMLICYEPRTRSYECYNKNNSVSVKVLPYWYYSSIIVAEMAVSVLLTISFGCCKTTKNLKWCECCCDEQVKKKKEEEENKNNNTNQENQQLLGAEQEDHEDYDSDSNEIELQEQPKEASQRINNEEEKVEIPDNRADKENNADTDDGKEAEIVNFSQFSYVVLFILRRIFFDKLELKIIEDSLIERNMIVIFGLVSLIWFLIIEFTNLIFLGLVSLLLVSTVLAAL